MLARTNWLKRLACQATAFTPLSRERDITADTDLRLCKFFGLTDGYFLRLQNAYDMLEARRKIAREVKRIKRYKSGKAA